MWITVGGCGWKIDNIGCRMMCLIGSCCFEFCLRLFGNGCEERYPVKIGKSVGRNGGEMGKGN